KVGVSKTCPHFDAQVVKHRDSAKRGVEVTTLASMIAKYSPILQAGDHVFDPSPSPTMAPPGSVSHDAIAVKDRGDELADSAISAVGEHATVVLADRLDDRPSVVHGIVSVARSARERRYDLSVRMPDNELRVARPAVVLRTRSLVVIAGRHQRSFED